MTERGCDWCACPLATPERSAFGQCLLLQPFGYGCFAAGLQGHQQCMVSLGQAVVRVELSEHMVQQPGSHFGIGQRAVGATGCGQAQMLCQGAQFVVGGLWVQPACQQHGAGNGWSDR